MPPCAARGRLSSCGMNGPQQRAFGRSPSAGHTNPGLATRRTHGERWRGGSPGLRARLPPSVRSAAGMGVGGAGLGGVGRSLDGGSAGSGWRPQSRARHRGVSGSGCARTIGDSDRHGVFPGRGERVHSRRRTWRGTRSHHRAGKKAGAVRPSRLLKTVCLVTPTVSNLAPGPRRNPELACSKLADESSDLWAWYLGKL